MMPDHANSSQWSLVIYTTSYGENAWVISRISRRSCEELQDGTDLLFRGADYVNVYRSSELRVITSCSDTDVARYNLLAPLNSKK